MLHAYVAAVVSRQVAVLAPISLLKQPGDLSLSLFDDQPVAAHVPHVRKAKHKRGCFMIKRTLEKEVGLGFPLLATQALTAIVNGK